MNPIFNYIITIHNKEDLIESVLNGVIKCCHENSFIYPVLDGCTDKSEVIIDEIISRNPDTKITKIKENDVHEILSINAGLRQSDQSVEGFNIILQDDVILLDYSIEFKIPRLYQMIGAKLGYLSFRLGANLKNNIFKSEQGSPFEDYIETAFGHGIDNADILLPGQFAFRTISIKSPVCIPTLLINQYGLLDEHLSPCFHDDTEYCLRLLKNGYRNGVFGIKFQSELEWGGTRRKLNANTNISKNIKRNMGYLKNKYHKDILNIISTRQEREIITFEEFSDVESNKTALEHYKLNKRKLEEFEMKNLSSFQQVKCYLKKLINYNKIWR